MESVPVILVVEDEEPLQQIVHDALEEGGFDLTTVASGQEAVAMIESGVVKYSALVTDINLKGPIPDLDRIRWMNMPEHRTVFIFFDLNVLSNASVKAASRGLAHELGKRGSHILFINLPEDCGVERHR